MHTLSACQSMACIFFGLPGVRSGEIILVHRIEIKISACDRTSMMAGAASLVPTYKHRHRNNVKSSKPVSLLSGLLKSLRLIIVACSAHVG